MAIGVETVSVKLSKPDSRFGLWPMKRKNTNRGMSGLCHGSIGRLVQIILFVVLFFQLSLFQLSVSFSVVVHIHRGYINKYDICFLTTCIILQVAEKFPSNLERSVIDDDECLKCGLKLSFYLMYTHTIGLPCNVARGNL